ncbi:uncharacterized membrane protein YcaP (DUF421 family) [Thermocatellispora tengchongensis]|uniref:Uncharacterized membrane protein YcaP (DUF421 family) n=1 Tax=Thermocatellispora tengchongensis TaxID=1073253 RepID=A0A840P3X8_9ACTN|nr:YetF domain-containing protein [Thermocatellispora tengchongensis]MBB5134378.1 uncharacterized membrane protein YcaP (DUF421 family) [Thermocatellispora tengchongensis]
MWADLMVSGIPLAEKAARTVLVYLSVVALLRVVGRRDLAQLNTFDLVVMLLLSNVVQNAIIGPDNSVLGAVFGAVVLLGTNAVLARAAARWNRLGALLEGRPVTLAEDGRYDSRTLARLGLRAADLEMAIKRQGGNRVTDVRSVTLEPGGTLLVRLRPEEENASHGDVAAINARLDRIEAMLTALSSRST